MATENKNLSYYDESTLPDASEFRIGIVVSEWNPDITENLLKGARETLLRLGVKENNIQVWHVPGSFELIYGVKRMQKNIFIDAIIAIGSIIRGETPHFEFVSQATAQGIKDLNVLNDTPVIFCVLTDNNKQQAVERSGGKHGNKGVESAVAAIKMAWLKKNS
jgi:6,7-dimethyl-8-ribityllumazine synthase